MWEPKQMAGVQVEQPKERASTIGDSVCETRKILSDCIVMTESLLSKHIGPRPGLTSSEKPKDQPSLRSDVRTLCDMATILDADLKQLHEIIGY